MFPTRSGTCGHNVGTRRDREGRSNHANIKDFGLGASTTVSPSLCPTFIGWSNLHLENEFSRHGL
jgi:hypothetical protein